MNKQEMKHTPTPWGYCYDGSSDWSIGEVSDPQGKFVANIWDKNDSRAQANAAFIVRAVNSHETLLEMLKKLTNKIDKHFYSLPENNENEGKEWKRLYEMACEAITQAEGKQP